MKAARLHSDEETLRVETLPTPSVPDGCVLVKLEATFLSPYMAALVDGSGGFETPPRPFTPGMDAIGWIEQIGDGVDGLTVGDAVFCDAYVEEARADRSGDYAFMGCFPISPGSGHLLKRWPDGALASHMVLPAQNVTSVTPALTMAGPEVLCRLGWLGTAYAAFEKTNFQPGQSVAVLGATGLLGVSTVLVALALGASRVVAVGRSEERLAAFNGFDPRVETSTQPPGQDAPVDLVVSTMSSANPDMVNAALNGMKRNGTLVFLAGPGAAIDTPDLITRDVSIRGSLWFSRPTIARLVQLIASGQLPLDRITSTTFSLSDVNNALREGAKPVPPFHQIVVTMD